MNKVINGLVWVIAVVFMLIGLRWAIAPAGVVAEFGMPLLDGLGRSTQIGDIGAIFIAGSSMVMIGMKSKNATWLYAPALLMATIAVMRTVAWGAHGATFATTQITVEVITTVLLIVAAKRMA